MKTKRNDKMMDAIKGIPRDYRKVKDGVFIKQQDGHTIRILIMSSCWDIDVSTGNKISFDNDKHIFHRGGSLRPYLFDGIGDAEKLIMNKRK